MIAPELLEILRCPENRQRLKPAGAALIDKLNQRVAARTLTNRGHQPVTQKLDGGLLREDGKVLYPVRQDIPIMLPDEGIVLDAG